jgi:acetate kinase
MSEISAVGHRVVHGGENFSGSVLINDDVIKGIEKCVEVSPLHNPHNLTGIRACREIMGDVPQIAVFDTSFHQTMPKTAYMYALPYEFYEKYKVRRYGFHGTSHRYVSERAAKVLGKDIKDLKIVTCHLGNGSSICAIDGGKSIDTSMGLTPLEGIMMGTRCGSIDPAIVSFIMDKEGITAKKMDDIMNKNSGVLGISGISSDFRDVESKIKEGNERAALAIDMFCYQVSKYIGAYAVAMGGLDAIVFTAGIGENNGVLRAKMCINLKFMGVELDSELNSQRGNEMDVSTKDAKVRVLSIPTNEELVIALDTKEIVEKL